MSKNPELPVTPPPVSYSSQSRTSTTGQDVKSLAFCISKLCITVHETFGVDPFFYLTDIHSINQRIMAAIVRGRLQVHDAAASIVDSP